MTYDVMWQEIEAVGVGVSDGDSGAPAQAPTVAQAMVSWASRAWAGAFGDKQGAAAGNNSSR
jgi:hypothetical protein